MSRTRGAAISIVALGEGRATFAGVGNVDGHLFSRGRERRLIPHRGIVGAYLPTLRSEDILLENDYWLLLLHSDGISSRMELSSLLEQNGSQPQALADAALARWGRPTDDATVVVVCPPPQERT